jgi:glycosidase
MKKVYAILIVLFLIVKINAQVITTEPAFPIEGQSVVVTFHADRGNKGLMNYTGDDVYAHTGVITDKSTSSSDWKYVKAAWTTNIAACKMSKLSANEYTLSVGSTIREFYGVPADEKILKMAFVFRNANAGKTGRDAGGADIFVNVYEEGLQVSFIQPADRFTMAVDTQPLPIEISAMDADSIFLYLDNNLINKVAGSSFDTAFITVDSKMHQLVAKAKKDATFAADTAWYIVPGPTVDRPIPAGYLDGITYPSGDSAVFILLAPGKDHIYMVGDFNDWLPDSIYQLHRDGDRFWVAIGNLTPQTEYAFQYLIDDTLRLTDPYVEKILDPDNDKFISDTVYPGLKMYPVDKTQGIVGVIQPGKQTFTWGDDAFVAPPSRELVIYELLIRDFVKTHAIKDVKAKLDYLQTLGVNAIELMPFNEFEGNSSWGYNPSFYFAPDKYYGRDTDLKDFIQECHNRGIAVIMDIVLNHAYGQNPMVRMYFNGITGKPTAENPWFNETSPNTAFSWGNDFNHQSPATRYFVNRVTEYWLTDYKIDGFRFDFTKGFTNVAGDGSGYDTSRITILKRIYDHIKSVNGNAYMICEHFAANSEEKVLSDYGMLIWGNSNYNYNEATMGYMAHSDFSWASYKSRDWTNPNLVSYMESHDEERLMYKNITYGNSTTGYNVKNLGTALKRMELAGAFFFTIPGPKMIWQFGELGYDVSIDYNGRVEEKPIKWEYWNNVDRQRVYLVWAKLNDLRKKYPVFQTDDFTMAVGNDVALKKIVLRHTEQDAIVIGNFGLTSGSIQPGFTKTGWWYGLFSGDSVNISDLNYAITLDAGEYEIYASQKLKSVISGTDKTEYTELSLYPNPAVNQLYINTERPLTSISIYNISGICVLKINNPGGSNVVDISGLPAGLFLIKSQDMNQIKTGKFIKKN